MSTRNIVLTDHQAQYVEQLVSSGRYPNVGEVLHEGLRLVEWRETLDVARLQALRDAVGLGDADIAAGHFDSFDTPDELGQHLAQLAAEELGA
jgi:antitoxin ParD1/3/4